MIIWARLVPPPAPQHPRWSEQILCETAPAKVGWGPRGISGMQGREENDRSLEILEIRITNDNNK